MNKINAVYVSLLALVVAVVALVMCAVNCASDKSASVEEAIKANPKLVIDAIQAAQNQAQEEALQKIRENIRANVDRLNNNADDGVLGNPAGNVVLVEFFDFSCGYCHKVYPAIKNLIAKNENLKVVAKPLAFLSPVSAYAARASIAAKEQGKFNEVFSALFENEGHLTEAKVDEIAVLAGADLVKLKEDMNSEKVQKVLNDANTLAADLQVNGVPTLILNGEMIQTLDEDVLQNAIDAANAK